MSRHMQRSALLRRGAHRGLRVARHLVFVLLALPCAASAFYFGERPPDAYVVEYLNDFTGHYVYLSDAAEISFVESGGAGPGWHLTGYYFYGYTLAESTQRSGREDICRLYSPRSNSHVLAAEAECAYLRENDPAWIFERVDFRIDMPHAGTCDLGLLAVYRLYNGRWFQNDANHRYTPSPQVRDAMLAGGWIDEGIAFCARGSELPR